MTRPIPILLLALTACRPPWSGKDDTAVVDTAPDADTDADADSDTDADADADSDADVDLTFEIEGDWENTALTLTWLWYEDEWFDPGATVAEVPVTMPTLDVHLAYVPEDEDLRALDPEGAPGLMGVFYLPALHRDEDGDGRHGDDEPYVGTGPGWLLYLAGTLPDEWGLMGFDLGWNAIEMDFGGAGITVLDLGAIPLETDLAENTSIKLAGSLNGDATTDALSIALLSWLYFTDDGVENLVDHPWSGGSLWEISVEEAPPANHITNMDGLEMALEMPIVYIDTDDPGYQVDVDYPLHWACTSDDLRAGIAWLSAPTDLDTALSFTVQDLTAGWIALAGADEGATRLLGAAEALDLKFSDECMPL